jgi:hypothetical protein
MRAETLRCPRVQYCWLCPTSAKLKFFDKFGWNSPVLNLVELDSINPEHLCADIQHFEAYSSNFAFRTRWKRQRTHKVFDCRSLTLRMCFHVRCNIIYQRLIRNCFWTAFLLLHVIYSRYLIFLPNNMACSTPVSLMSVHFCAQLQYLHYLASIFVRIFVLWWVVKYLVGNSHGQIEEQYRNFVGGAEKDLEHYKSTGETAIFKAKALFIQ